MKSTHCNKNSAPSFPRAAAAYVHVPFCRRKCRYCDFYSVPVRRRQGRQYVEALAVELGRYAGALARPADSIFVGGGTPTALPAESLAALLALLRPYVGPRTEVTVEANPGTADEAAMAALVEGGVNRVSLGVQSFRASELRLLGRIPPPGQGRRAVRQLRRAGLANISVDLIYGIPGQTLQSWQRSLAEAIDLGVEHLSCYCLTFEPGTGLWADRAARLVREMDELLQRLCYETAIRTADQAGFEQYEISNFARPGRRCRHNVTYWLNGSYIGLGPAAAGYLGGRRWTNRPDVEAWRAALLAGRAAPARAETLIGAARMAETLMLGLRMTGGVSRRAFARRFGQDPVEAFPQSISRHKGLGSLLVSARRIRLSPRYYFTSNAVLADIVAEGTSGRRHRVRR